MTLNKDSLSNDDDVPKTDKRGSNSAFTVRNSLLAGSAAGIASTIACHPFDVIRVKMQSSAPVVTNITTATTTKNLRPLVDTIRTTIHCGGGIQALYTGLAMPLIFQAIYKSTIFTVNRTTESFIQEWKTKRHNNNNNDNNSAVKIPYKHTLTLTDRFVSGFMGGAINAILFCTPVEYVRNQQITKIGKNRCGSNAIIKQQRNCIFPVGPVSIIQQTIQKNGITGLWKGMVSTVLRDSVGCGLFFVAMTYAQEQLVKPRDATVVAHHHHQQQQQQQRQQQQNPSPSPSTSVVILSGAFAGVAFWIWALPIDTMKTWIQNGAATNLKDAFRISQRHGFMNSIPSLFRGYEVAYLRGAPSAAITVLTYSLVFQNLEETTAATALHE